MDPATGYDTIANVGLIGNRIALITTDDINGKTTIDASNLVVAPGFIDVLSYEPNSYGVWYKLGDGVTTNLGMHGIKSPVDAKGFFSNYTGKNAPPINFGGAFSDQWYRDSIGVKSVATPAQLSRLSEDLNKQLNAGWIGLSIDPEYAPSINFNEYAALAQVAKQAEMPLFTHIRYSSPGPAGKSSLDAIDEVLNVARQTGVSLHVDHIPSMATHVMPEAIAKIDTARSEGLDITGCFYPYTFWGTYLGSARFAGDWQSRFRISYNDLQLAGSSERLTPESFKKYQAQNKLVVAYAIPQGDVNAALSAPWSLVGSDAIPESSNNNHPRGAGCFSRLLGPYVRDMGALSLMDALAKCTILPAKRLDAASRCSPAKVDSKWTQMPTSPFLILQRSPIHQPSRSRRRCLRAFPMCSLPGPSPKTPAASSATAAAAEQSLVNRVVERAVTRSLTTRPKNGDFSFIYRSSCYGSWAIVRRISILLRNRAHFCPSANGVQPW